MKKFLLLLFCTFALFPLYSQPAFKVGLIGSPSVSNLHGRPDWNKTDNISSVNFGLKAYLSTGRWAFSTGILHLTQGASFEYEETSTANPEGTGEKFDVYFRARGITIPIGVDYIFWKNENTQLFGGAGIYLGDLYKQEEENTSIPEDFKPDPLVTYPYGPPSRFRESKWFDDFYAGANVGLGLNQKLSDRMSVQFRPNFLYQLRKSKSAEQAAWTNRLMSFALDVGVFYHLGR